MALTKAELKMIVKQCLVEILSEGLNPAQFQQSPAPASSVRGSVTEQRHAQPRRRPAFDPALDTPLRGTGGSARLPSDTMREAVIRGSGGNPILADILADTAMTTLPTQMSAGHDSVGGAMADPSSVSRNHIPVQQEQFNGTPEQVFGEVAAMRADGSSHWADLAFGPPNKKST